MVVHLVLINDGKHSLKRDYMNKLVLIILCVLLPPLGVFFAKGVGKDLLINIVLTLFFWVPGMIHALWVTTR